ncbi:OPT super [Blastocladiella emersonii ATCC 22665]|nr:OPT super [Blastocladiella emersonii ATCC 22665]
MAADDKLAEKGVEKQESSFVVDAEFEKIVNDLAPTTDDVNTPSLTFRVWVLGTLFCVILGGINQLFAFRTVFFSITSYVAVLLAYPLGVLMAKTLPSIKFNLFGVEVDTNPGPFSVKEHVLIGIFGSTGAAGIYGSENIIVQEIFYDMDIGVIGGLGFLIGTSTLGFGLSGICRRFLIRPSHMVWPSVLPSIAMYTAFHDVKVAAVDEEYDAKSMSRLRFFLIAAFAAFAYYILGPGLFTPAMANLSFLCWFGPRDNKHVQMLGSPVAGLGIGSITLDWANINSGWMSYPYWSSVNLIASYVLFNWVLSSISISGNWFNLPKTKLIYNSTKLIDNTGKQTDGRSFVDPETSVLIQEKYDELKPFKMADSFAWSYGGSMATFTGAISHTIVWFGKDIVGRFREAKNDEDKDDIHCQLIDKYPEVPDTWYYGFFVITTIISIAVCEFTQIKMSWYFTLLTILLSVVATVPIAVVLATSGIALYMNVISEFVIGLIYPGHPVVMMAFKCLGVTVSSQCLTLLSDLKIGHYMKIPPRHVFIVQIFSQLLAVFVCYGTMRLWLSNEDHRKWITMFGTDELAQDKAGHNWGGQYPNIYYAASLIWGAIGPIRFFYESVYGPLITGGLILGFIFPVVMKAGHIFIGDEVIPWQLISAPILFTVSSSGANQGVVVSGFIVATFFQYYMYRKQQPWWKKYNYVLATALDVGTGLASLFITLVLGNVDFTVPFWAGNPDLEEEGKLEVYGRFMDWCNC